jgi:hypothetical protein
VRHCGAAFRLHRPLASDVSGLAVEVAGRQYVTAQGLRKLADRGAHLACPTAARPDSLAGAMQQLLAATLAGNATAVFSARGEVQRLMDHRPLGADHCKVCAVLAAG